jgi:ankyrin repeat protein
MSLLGLPCELSLSIVEQLESERDINALTQTCRQLYTILNPFLYQYTLRSSDKAITWAAKNGMEGACQKLLAEAAMLPDRENCAMDMLRLAAAEGHEGLVTWLLSTGHIDPSDLNPKLPPVPSDRKAIPDPPLFCAAAGGHVGVVRLLLEHPSADPNVTHKYGRTALSLAAENGHEAVVELLLEQPAIEPNMSNLHGRTPLYYAAAEGHEAVVRLLLERDDVDPDAASKYGYKKTPLARAACEGHLGIVKLLLAKGADPQHPADALSPLFWAASEGHEEILRLLLAQDKVDPNAGDDTDRTPLWIATVNNQGRMADLIRADRRFDPTRED